MAINDRDDFEALGSEYIDCNVFQLSVKETGEIFYVGYDSEEFRSEPMDMPSLSWQNAKRIMNYLETEKTIIMHGVSEAEAARYVEKLISQLDGDNILCDYKNTALFYSEEYQIGVAPKHEVTRVEQHYLKMRAQAFDKVDIDNLKTVFLDSAFLTREVLAGVYDNQYDYYYLELKNKLKAIGAKICQSQYAKSISAWIALGGSSAYLFNQSEESAIQKLGKRVPSYHMLDVLEALKNINIEGLQMETKSDIDIHPINNRCPWREVKNLHNERAGFAIGFPLYKKGETLRLQGDIEKAIVLFNQARENGYDAPGLYESYEKAYRKLKDYENEIAILLEEKERRMEEHDKDAEWAPFFLSIDEKIEKAKDRLNRTRGKR